MASHERRHINKRSCARVTLERAVLAASQYPLLDRYSIRMVYGPNPAFIHPENSFAEDFSSETTEPPHLISQNMFDFQACEEIQVASARSDHGRRWGAVVGQLQVFLDPITDGA